MKNATIARRLQLMIGVSVFTLLLVGLAGLLVINQGSESLRLISDSTLPRVQALGEARQVFMEARVNMYALFLNTDQWEVDALEQRLGANAGEIQMKLKNYEKLIVSADDKKMLDADVTHIKAYLEYFDNEVMPLLRSNETEKARDLLLTKMAPLGYNALQGLNAHMAYNAKTSQEVSGQTIASAGKGKTAAAAAMLAGILAVGVLGFFLLRNIRASLAQIQAMVARIESDLDFTVRVDVTRHDEIGRTTASLNRLLDKLQGNLKAIADGAQSVAAASADVSQTAANVARASQQQSAAASDMAATVEQMTVSINHVGDRSQEANHLSSESGQLASDGEAVIGQTVGDMHEIATTVNQAAELLHTLERHSQQISAVIAVIRDVADQTNLLALNAAIEAARAGEQGRGFAVVADEVRKLAERTAASTKEIGETIGAMRGSANEAVASMQGVVQRVARGVERAQEANVAIQKIGVGSRGTVGMVEEITAAIREQGAATNNIAQQVEQVAQMSEESSAAAAESARAADELDRLAGEMRHIVSSYRL